MSSSLRAANVYVNGVLSGTLSEIDEGYSFEYAKDYLISDSPAVSLTLPKREEPYISTTLFPFFDGLIPEGWLLNVVVKNWKLDEKDRFGLLLVACKDCIGNVSIEEARV